MSIIKFRDGHEVLRRELKVEPILKKTHKQQLKWFGDFMRMIVKKVWQTRMIRRRKRGRPKKTCENSIAAI